MAFCSLDEHDWFCIAAYQGYTCSQHSSSTALKALAATAPFMRVSNAPPRQPCTCKLLRQLLQADSTPDLVPFSPVVLCEWRSAANSKMPWSSARRARAREPRFVTRPRSFVPCSLGLLLQVCRHLCFVHYNLQCDGAWRPPPPAGSSDRFPEGSVNGFRPASVHQTVAS